MSEVAVVFGLCALSFAAGCVLTAIMLRRDAPPEPAAEPVPDPPAPLVEPQWPPEDYATRPIHRNPVMGLPAALPAPPSRPNLVLVPDPRPEAERPVRPDEVRRMHVVREGAEPATSLLALAGTAELSVLADLPDDAVAPVPAEPAEPVVLQVPAQPEPVLVEAPAAQPEDVEPEKPASAEPTDASPDPGARVEPSIESVAEPCAAEPCAAESCADPAAARPRSESNR